MGNFPFHLLSTKCLVWVSESIIHLIMCIRRLLQFERRTGSFPLRRLPSTRNNLKCRGHSQILLHSLLFNVITPKLTDHVTEKVRESFSSDHNLALFIQILSYPIKYYYDAPKLVTLRQLVSCWKCIITQISSRSFHF